MEASAPSNPSSSDPAIGCPGTNRGSVTSEEMAVLTEPTSVTTPVVNANDSVTASANIPTGVATKVTSASEYKPGNEIISRSRATSIFDLSESCPPTS